MSNVSVNVHIKPEDIISVYAGRATAWLTVGDVTLFLPSNYGSEEEEREQHKVLEKIEAACAELRASLPRHAA